MDCVKKAHVEHLASGNDMPGLASELRLTLLSFVSIIPPREGHFCPLAMLVDQKRSLVET